jgi:16S rRNA (cytosine967-C5)-methyltransferase
VTKRKPREIAARALLGREQDSASGESGRARELAGLSAADRHLCLELIAGVTRQQALLDWLIARKARHPSQRPALRTLLRLGVYQLFWLDRVPDHAVVHETVELTRQLDCATQAGFVNALLRTYIRERPETLELIDRLKIEQPHLGYSHPQWLCARWNERWGPSILRQLLEWNNSAPRTFARVNTLRSDAGRLLAQWRDEDVSYDFIRRDWIEENSVFQLKEHPPIDSLPSFKQGAFYVQDPSTLLATALLDPRPGDHVLDLCAAPGGKTTHVAQLLGNQGRILACDPQPDRLKLLRENCERLGVTCVEPCLEVVEGPELPLFDKVLVDAPCSNSGVMRRRVELRWRIRPEEIQRLSRLQLSLLRRAASVVKPDGVVVYSTCSLEPEENAEVVRGFLDDNPGFSIECERSLAPFTDGVDGAYVARLRAPSRQ